MGGSVAASVVLSALVSCLKLIRGSPCALLFCFSLVPAAAIAVSAAAAHLSARVASRRSPRNPSAATNLLTRPAPAPPSIGSRSNLHARTARFPRASSTDDRDGLEHGDWTSARSCGKRARSTEWIISTVAAFGGQSSIRLSVATEAAAAVETGATVHESTRVLSEWIGLFLRVASPSSEWKRAFPRVHLKAQEPAAR